MRTRLLRTASVVGATTALVLLGQTSAFAATYTLRQGDDFVRVNEGSVYVQDKECDFHTAYVRVRQLRTDGTVIRSWYGEDGSCHGDGVYPDVPIFGSPGRFQMKVCETHPGDDSCTYYHDVPNSALG